MVKGPHTWTLRLHLSPACSSAAMGEVPGFVLGMLQAGKRQYLGDEVSNTV